MRHGCHVGGVGARGGGVGVREARISGAGCASVPPQQTGGAPRRTAAWRASPRRWLCCPCSCARSAAAWRLRCRGCCRRRCWWRSIKALPMSNGGSDVTAARAPPRVVRTARSSPSGPLHEPPTPSLPAACTCSCPAPRRAARPRHAQRRVARRALRPVAPRCRRVRSLPLSLAFALSRRASPGRSPLCRRRCAARFRTSTARRQPLTPRPMRRSRCWSWTTGRRAPPRVQPPGLGAADAFCAADAPPRRRAAGAAARGAGGRAAQHQCAPPRRARACAGKRAPWSLA